MSTQPRRLQETRALLPGGTSGIGLATAQQLLDPGGVPAIRIAGRSVARGEQAVTALRECAPGADIGFLRADCGNPESAAAMAERAAREMGGIDLLIASTGGNHLPELLARTPLAEVAAIITDDLLPGLLACRAALPYLVSAGGGCVIAVASDAAKVATPGETIIGASMAATVQFIRGLAIEGKRDGIRANCVTPSLVEGTPLTDRLMAEGTFSQRLFRKARPLAALGPTTPQDLAALIVFLASPAAARITGQAISVNGGISAA